MLRMYWNRSLLLGNFSLATKLLHDVLIPNALAVANGVRGRLSLDHTDIYALKKRDRPVVVGLIPYRFRGQFLDPIAVIRLLFLPRARIRIRLIRYIQWRSMLD